MGWDLLAGTVAGDFDLDCYDFVLINGNVELLDLILEVKNSFKVKVAVLTEGSLSALSYFSTESKIKYIQSLRAVDAIGTLGFTGQWHRLFTDKPVCWLGVPFPVEEVQRYSVPIEQREHVWGMGSNLNSHNTIGSLFVAKAAGVKRVWMQEFAIDQLDRFCGELGLELVEKHRSLPWVKFLERYRRCWGGICLTNEFTWGRYALDFAALGMPVVGSVRQFAQRILFPTLSFEPYLEADKAVAAVKRLEKDLNYYKEITEYARHQLNIFDMDSARRRMQCLLEKVL